MALSNAAHHKVINMADTRTDWRTMINAMQCNEQMKAESKDCNSTYSGRRHSITELWTEHTAACVQRTTIIHLSWHHHLTCRWWWWWWVFRLRTSCSTAHQTTSVIVLSITTLALFTATATCRYFSEYCTMSHFNFWLSLSLVKVTQCIQMWQYKCTAIIITSTLHVDTKTSILQCESKKNPPLRFSGIFSQTVGNF